MPSGPTEARSRHLTGCGAAAALAAGVVAANTWPRAWSSVEVVGSAPFPAAVESAVVVAAALAAGYVLLAITCALLVPRVRLLPRLAQSALVTGVVVVATAPAHGAADRDLDGLPLPDRPLVGETQERTDTVRTVTVRTGDTLWWIASGQLPRDASTARVAEACRALYQANRDVIGADPNLILPGQTLTVEVP